MLMKFTPYPDLEEGSVYINPDHVVAVLPSDPDPEHVLTAIFTVNDQTYRVDEDLEEVVKALSPAA